MLMQSESRAGPPRFVPPAVGFGCLLRLRLVGQMGAIYDGRPLALPKVRKTRAVLAILAMAGGKPVLREYVTSLLWSKREREQARASLRQAVHELQEMFGPLDGPGIISERHHLRLADDNLWVDVHAIARATATRPEALDLLDGGMLEDLHGLDPAFDEHLAAELRRMRDTAAGVAAAFLQLKTEPDAMIDAAERLLGFAPTHEGAWRSLMQAHAGKGDRAQAIEVYEHCAAALAQCAQAFPSAETNMLLGALRAGGLAEAGRELGTPAAPVPRLRQELPTSRRGAWLGIANFRSNESGDAADFSAGLAEEITTALARFRWINLIAPSSIAALSGEPMRDSARWQGLELDFLLDGSVQRAGAQIRVTVRLLDMRAGGEVIWSHRFDSATSDLLKLQDDIAAATVAQVDPELLLHESRAAAARPIQDATAHELMLRAIPAIYRLEETEFLAAGELLAQAGERAPDSGAIFAWWACWHTFLVGQGWAADSSAAMQRAGELAERAVVLDPSCARALAVAAHVRSFVQHQSIEETIGLHERALALNPNLPFAWVSSGLTLSYAGQHDAAITRIEHAKRLSPFDPHGFFFDSALMVPHLSRGDFETVVALGRATTALKPSMSASYKSLLAALGHLGRLEEAVAVRKHLLALEPNFTIAAAGARTPLRQPADIEIYLSGLRLAGLAEG